MLKILFHGYFTFILDFITDIYLYWISGIKNKRFCFEIFENFKYLTLCLPSLVGFCQANTVLSFRAVASAILSSNLRKTHVIVKMALI